MESWSGAGDENWRSPIEVNRGLPQRPSNTSAGWSQPNTMHPRDAGIAMFIVTVVTSTKTWNQSRGASTDKQIF